MKLESFLQGRMMKMIKLSKSTTRLIDGYASLSRFIDSLDFDTRVWRNKIFTDDNGKRGDLIAIVVNLKKKKK